MEQAEETPEKARCYDCFRWLPTSELEIEPCCAAPDCDRNIYICRDCGQRFEE